MKNLDKDFEIALFKQFDAVVQTDLEAGKIYWAKHHKSTLIGVECGTSVVFHRTPYRIIRFQGRNIRAHRFLFWKYHGYIVDIIDHKNGNGLDNTKGNLRESDATANALNHHAPVRSRTGEMGIYKTKIDSYQVQRKIAGKVVSFGTYTTIEEAITVRDKIYETL